MNDKSTHFPIEWDHENSLSFDLRFTGYIVMSPANTGETSGYFVLIQGHLGKSLTSWFEGLEVTALPNGNTIIIGKDLDQAAMFGLLLCIRDLGIPLILSARRDLQGDEIGKLFSTTEEERE